MTENLLHLQRWIQSLEEHEDGWHCRVGYTITESREERVEAIQSTPLTAARYAYKLAKAHYSDRRDNYYLKRGYEETLTPFRNKGVYEHKKKGHLLAWKRGGWHCQYCDDTSLYMPSDSQDLNCPKVKRYRSWDSIPENLKSPSQLYEMGYSKGKTKLPEAEGAIAWKNPHIRKAEWQWVYLYPVDKAVKRTLTKSQEKALRQAHRAKGSSLEIIKAVTEILSSDYTVVSEYKGNPSNWYKNYYSLRIKLGDMVLFDEYLSRRKSRAIELAKSRANDIRKFHEIYVIAEPLVDWSNLELRFWCEDAWREDEIEIAIGYHDDLCISRTFVNPEHAKQMLPLEIPEMIKEL